MSFEAVFSFITQVDADPELGGDVAALDVDGTNPAAVTALANALGFDFTEEEYRFLWPYALAQLRPKTSRPDAADVDSPPQRHLKYPLVTCPILLGNSHASVIKLAAEATHFPLNVFSFALDPQPYVNSEYPSELSHFHPLIAETISTGAVFSAIGRSMHERMFLMQHPRKFDFSCPSAHTCHCRRMPNSRLWAR